MNKVILHIAIAFGVISQISCASGGVTNKHVDGVKFSDIVSDYVLTDENNYGCNQIDVAVLTHILQTGTLVTEKEIHDYYSTTGCTIKGTILVNGKKLGFTYEYGGILWLGKDMTLGCGKDCCRDDYPYCSYDLENLR